MPKTWPLLVFESLKYCAEKGYSKLTLRFFFMKVTVCMIEGNLIVIYNVCGFVSCTGCFKVKLKEQNMRTNENQLREIFKRDFMRKYVAGRWFSYVFTLQQSFSEFRTLIFNHE
jgi:hypothetical protein